ncbi:MAG: MarR family transcriptional regulator [Pseudomonadota bacterium]
MATKSFKFHLLLHSAHLVEDRLRRKLAPHGLQPRQARILDALDRLGKVSQVRLATEFALTAASISTMTSRLLAAGLIERDVDESERRSNELSLTRRGRALLKIVHKEWAAIDRDIAAVMGTASANQLAELTRTLRDGLGGFAPGTSADSAKQQTVRRGKR